ncbi:hypothetical protein [Bradyrhizobium sp.]|uniref:hypothetical protein n=1 Tax=Bradyrhizobium sp. TaxID=376 RepID=UPI001DE75677|nr:hypothetical protein [Bradyrhizobium sp.]MBV8701929.1 hypothetical protein [Bradyrhizobium sp.]MBV9982366.1 hypothetical protein [Bradyrhizobium sp.]
MTSSAKTAVLTGLSFTKMSYFVAIPFLSSANSILTRFPQCWTSMIGFIAIVAHPVAKSMLAPGCAFHRDVGLTPLADALPAMHTRPRANYSSSLGLHREYIELRWQTLRWLANQGDRPQITLTPETNSAASARPHFEYRSSVS